MRRNRQELPQAECIELITRSTSGVLSLVGDGGYPYGVPLSYVYRDGALFFHSAVEGHKVDAVRADGRCSFTIVAKDEVHPGEYTTYFRSVIVFGRISIIADEAEKIAALRLIGERYNPGDDVALNREVGKHLTSAGHLQHMLLLRLDIEHLSGKEAIELVRAREQKHLTS